jgi:membrane-bound ClpP family serine protease
MSSLAIAILMIVAALVVLGLDMVLPSGGILVGVAAILAVVGVGYGYSYSINFGNVLTLLCLVSIPIIIHVFIKVYPNTAFGRKMMVGRPNAVPYQYDEKKTNHAMTIGDVGLAKTNLQPSGKIILEGKVYEAITSAGIIPAGSSIVVTDIEMNVATVELYLDESDLRSTSETEPRDEDGRAAKQNEGDLLEMSPDTFKLNDFDSPKEPSV